MIYTIYLEGFKPISQFGWRITAGWYLPADAGGGW